MLIFTTSQPLDVRARLLIPLVLLLVGLLAGFGAGAVMRPLPTTVTETVKSTIYSTLRETETVSLTVRETATRTTTSVLTQVVLSTATQTLTQTRQTTTTVVRTTTALTTVYPAERGTILVTDSGSGNKDTRPFTLQSASDLKITVRIRAQADLEYVGFAWYLYNVELERWLKRGDVWEDEGVFEFYAANVPPGNWYVKILAANCRWEITVEKVT